jgi:4-hydroxythreonine-4-phosphate dehydrogenase
MLKKIAITMGDPSGIGAEVIIKALLNKQRIPEFLPVVIGDAAVLKLNCEILKCNLKFIQIKQSGLADLRPPADNSCYLLATTDIDLDDFSFGEVRPGYGQAAGCYIQTAAALVKQKKLDALVTAPINKRAFNLAGYRFQGHTDFLAHLTGSANEVMMLSGGKLNVVLCTVHVSLADSIRSISEDLIIKTAVVADDAFKKYFKKSAPRFALAALNPHASEAGSFGGEEEKVIIPAAKKLREKGIDITDPMPPDSLFYFAKDGIYDAVICMYHDQGLIPLKLLYFDTGINITLGLDIIRTSVDHGTAFEIAGKGKACESSMLNAIKKAVEMSINEQ